MSDVAWCAASTCWGCGRWVKHRDRDHRMRRHACCLRWLSRARWKARLDGWHEGYRTAVQNLDDPLVLADADDYGTGWAGHMRAGHITVAMGGDEP